MAGIFALWKDNRQRTFFLIYLAAIVEKADEALLPAVFNEVGKAFGISPTGLGALTLACVLSQALSNPLAAFLAIQYDRSSVIAIGALIWAISTSAAAFSSNFHQVLE